MMRLLICSIIITVSLLLSCQRHSKELPEFVVFDLQASLSHPESFVMSDLVSSISYIPLETKQESLIGLVHMITIAEDKILLAGRDEAIKVFSADGSYSHGIGRIGKGPGEYSHVRSLSWNDSNKEVVVYNIGNASLQFYSLDGQFRRNCKVPHSPMFVYPLQNGKYLGALLFDSQIDSVFGKVFQFDTTGMVVGYGHEKSTEQKIPLTFVMPSYFRMGSKDLFIPERSDTLFQVLDGQLVPIASLGFGKLMVPDEVYYNRAATDEKSKYISYLNGYGLNEDEFVVEFRKGQQNYLAFCDLKKGKSKLMKMDPSGITKNPVAG